MIHPRPRATICILAPLLLACSLWPASAQPTNAPISTNISSQVVEVAGTVEFALAGAPDWHPAKPKQLLHPGDRLRTQADSRATIQLSDKSVIRVNQSTLLEIQPPLSAPAQHRFRLRNGSLFFFDREKPAAIEFETPLAIGAIRGTEFFLSAAAADGTTLLALLDGAVELRAGDAAVSLASGQEARVEPGKPPAVTPMLPAVNLIQWCFYYPAVLNPAELEFTDAEKNALENSLSAYKPGNLLGALAATPENFNPISDSARAYLAALKLAVGQVDAAESALASLPAEAPSTLALRELIAAARFQEWSSPRVPGFASEWLAHSYYLQSRSRLGEAREAARQATVLAPEFGFAWARLAELEFGFENRLAAREALARARRLAPRHAPSLALEGFILLDENNPKDALAWFDRAIEVDAALPTAWLGRGLAHAQTRRSDEGRRDLEVAAALEPRRGIFRSYLGKAWGQTSQDALAEKEFALAKQLDPSDPTAWLYSALYHQQVNRFNEAARELERSVELNGNRGVFRSKFLLDRDRAIRSADLAAVYNGVGLMEPSERSATRAIQDDYANFSGHLFLARSLQAREDPARVDLRLETPRESELLVANLLAPPGAGNLSQLLSQQDHLQYFEPRPVGFSAVGEYRSRGDWLQTASVFGQLGGFGYALDSQYISQAGQRPNNGLEQISVSFQAKQQLTPQDSLYLQAGYFQSDSGDVAQHYDPAMAIVGLRAKEYQEPTLFLGYHHEWAPGIHTLFLAGRLNDRLSLQDPQPNPLFLRYGAAGQLVSAQTDPFFTLEANTEFTLYSAELQQLWESPHHALIVGARYQSGTIDAEAAMSRGLSGLVSDQHFTPDMERANGYGYYQWRPVEAFHFTAGLAYDYLSFPRNVYLPPIDPTEDHRSLVSPKLGATFEPWQGGYLRAAWTRSLGGLFFDNSIRLEPVQVAGFIDAYRSLIPESVAGLAPGTKFETWGAGFDQVLPSSTYFGITAELLQSTGDRTVGAFTNSLPFPVPDSPSGTRQRLDFRERSLSVYVSQLIGRRWATGARYRLSEAKLTGRFPDLPATLPGVSNLAQDERSVLNHVQLYLLFNHETGFFAEWDSDWYQQSNHGYTPDRPGDSFWQHNIFGGYRFWHRHAEVGVGVLNLTAQDYHLNPLNLQPELPRARTAIARVRVNF